MSVDNDRYTIVMGYEVVFDGGSDKMKNICMFAAVRIIPIVMQLPVLGRHIGKV